VEATGADDGGQAALVESVAHPRLQARHAKRDAGAREVARQLVDRRQAGAVDVGDRLAVDDQPTRWVGAPRTASCTRPLM
jgi:hypothetical protein